MDIIRILVIKAFKITAKIPKKFPEQPNDPLCQRPVFVVVLRIKYVYMIVIPHVEHRTGRPSMAPCLVEYRERWVRISKSTITHPPIGHGANLNKVSFYKSLVNGHLALVPVLSSHAWDTPKNTINYDVPNRDVFYVKRKTPMKLITGLAKRRSMWSISPRYRQTCPGLENTVKIGKKDNLPPFVMAVICQSLFQLITNSQPKNPKGSFSLHVILHQEFVSILMSPHRWNSPEAAGRPRRCRPFRRHRPRRPLRCAPRRRGAGRPPD